MRSGRQAVLGANADFRKQALVFCAQGAGAPADLVLGQLPHREGQPGELPLAQHVQDVGLVLRRVGAPPQVEAGGVALQADVMAGGQGVEEDAHPMLVLAHMHPVMLVYDLDQTEGEEVPEHLKNFAKATGEFDPDRLQITLENAERMCILVHRQSFPERGVSGSTAPMTPMSRICGWEQALGQSARVTRNSW